MQFCFACCLTSVAACGPSANATFSDHFAGDRDRSAAALVDLMEKLEHALRHEKSEGPAPGVGEGDRVGARLSDQLEARPALFRGEPIHFSPMPQLVPVQVAIGARRFFLRRFEDLRNPRS
jgi:hypothetical protein